MRPRPVTAYSMCSALGSSRAEVESALREGVPRLSPPPFELPFETVCGLYPDSLPELPPSYAGYRSRTARLTWMLLDGISAAVGRALSRYGRERVAIVLGTSTGGIDELENAETERLRTGKVPFDFDFVRQNGFGGVLDLIAQATGIAGPRYVVSTACSSSAKALGSALRLLELGAADAVVTGGVDGICRTTLHGFHSLGVLAETPCRPFAVDRKGMNIGEGGALFLLERAGDGEAELLAVGETSDAYQMSAPDPSGAQAKQAMEMALAMAGRDPSEVDWVNAHGTGTKQNDAAEARAIADALGSKAPVVSTKGHTGHLLGAAGAIEAALSILALGSGFVPRNAGLDGAGVDPALSIDVVRTTLARPTRLLLSNSFAFGGSNASVLIGASR